MFEASFGPSGIKAEAADPPVSAPPDPVRVFPDANLAAAVRTACGLGVGADIHQSDLDKVTTFDASGLGIVVLTGMEYWLTLLELYLSNNSIVDVSPLAPLTSLGFLFLDLNNISDISPIAMTSGQLYIMDLPLNQAAYNIYIPALIAAGVTVDYPAIWRSPDGFVDSLGSWSDEALAYDENTATYAYVAQNLNMWTNWVRFTFSSPVLAPPEFRIWMSHNPGATPKTCQVKAYDGEGSEETLINQSITHDQYVVVPVTTLTKISYFEVRFEGQTGVTFNIYVNEVGVYGL